MQRRPSSFRPGEPLFYLRVVCINTASASGGGSGSANGGAFVPTGAGAASSPSSFAGTMSVSPHKPRAGASPSPSPRASAAVIALPAHVEYWFAVPQRGCVCASSSSYSYSYASFHYPPLFSLHVLFSLFFLSFSLCVFYDTYSSEIVFLDSKVFLTILHFQINLQYSLQLIIRRLRERVFKGIFLSFPSFNLFMQYCSTLQCHFKISSKLIHN